jgi:putative spermidine/putrescine transport system permease protein
VLKPTRRMSRGAWLAAAGTALLAAVPVVLLALWSAARGWYWPALLPRGWSARAWTYIFSPASGVAEALLTSCLIALAVAVLAVAAALPAGRALALHRFRGKQAVLMILLLPVVAPPLAAAMGVHGLFVRYSLTDTLLGVTLVHLIPAVPYATLMLTGAFARFDPDCEAQARTLAQAPWPSGATSRCPP